MNRQIAALSALIAFAVANTMALAMFAALMYKPSDWEVVALLAVVATTGLISVAAYAGAPETRLTHAPVISSAATAVSSE